MKRKFAFYCMIALFLLLTSCAPSAEEIATMTASAWTPTPPPTAIPTLTPTPVIPFDLTVSVVDEAGAAIAGASITFPESGNGSPVQASDQGQYSWADLPGEAVSLAVSGQGYKNTEQTATIQRGPNQVNVTLQRDPFGILLAEACAAGQKVLYIEDFQDGQAQGWPSLSAGINGDMPNGWSLIDESGNKILSLANAPSGGGETLQDYNFNNFVWHLKYKVIGKDSEMFFMWRLSHAGEETRRYASVMGAAFPPFMVRFLDKPNGQGVSMNVDETSTKLAEDQWLNFDVAYYAGTHQVWMDGKKFMEYLDTLPYPEGAIGFEEHLDQSKTTQFFLDDLVVCELTAPYEPPQ